MADVGDLRVKLSLDNAQFERSVASMNRTLQTMGQEIRGLQNRGKEWGSSIDGLKSKQEAYSRLLEGQQTKVRRLAEEYEKAKQQYGEHSEQAERLAVQLNRASAEMDRTERELRETTAELERQERELAQSQTAWGRLGDSASAAGEKLKAVGDKVKEIGKELSMKVSAPLIGLGTLAAKVGSDFEASMSKVAAISGATGSDLASLEAKAREMGATTQFSASEAADALSYMAMAGWKTNDMLAGIGGVMNLAAASGEDLAMVSDIVTDALTAFGMTANDTGKFVDILAAASSNSNTNVAMLGESFKYAAPVVGALKMSADDAALALGLMANAGIKGSNSGTALRTMLTNLASPTKEMQKSMDSLGISLTDSDGKMKTLRQVMDELRGTFDKLTPAQQASEAATIFGKEAMSGALAIINASDADYKKLANSIDKSAGAAEKMAKVMNDNLQGRLKEMKSALEEAAISIYKAMEPALESLVAKIQKLADWFNTLSPEMLRIIVVFGGIVAAIGPVLVVVGVLVSSIGSIVSAFGAVSLVLAEAGGVMALISAKLGFLGTAASALTGPIGIAITAVVAIGAALVVAYNKVDWFREGVNNSWNKIKDLTSQAFIKVGEFITSLINDAVTFASGILDKFKAFWDENGKFIVSIVKLHFEQIKSNIEMVMGIIKGIFEVVWPVISGVVKITWNIIKTAISNTLDTILGIIQTVMKLIQGDWKGAWETIKKTSEKIMNNIVKFFKDVDLLQVGKDMIQGLINGIGSMASAVMKKVKSIADSITTTAKNALDIHSPSDVLIVVTDKIGLKSISKAIQNSKERKAANTNNQSELNVFSNVLAQQFKVAGVQ